MRSYSIAHITPSVGQTSFGLGQVALNLCREQSILGSDANIWCVDRDEDRQWASQSSGLVGSRIHGFPTRGPGFLQYSPQMEGEAGSGGRRIQVAHQHGMWTCVSRATNRLRDDHGIPTVIAPHGSLSPWALNRSQWKKKLALTFYEGRNLHSAACLHATSEAEIADFRNFGLANPIAFIPNGIAEKALHAVGDAARFRSEFNIPDKRRILFFLSRITPKKGLPMLIEAIDSMREEFADWILVVAGIDEFGHKAEVDALIKRQGLSDRVMIVGSVFDQAKHDAFAATELFILPSHSEGAPIVILDCLAAGVPVITTTASSWQDLNTYRCGWWVEISTGAIRAALKEALPMPAAGLREMGARGKALVSQKYSWQTLAGETLALYRWLLGEGDRPGFVILD